jgi:hypothetical protein
LRNILTWGILLSTGNSWVDQQLDAAASALARQWRESPRAVQPENNLKPDTAQLQFRIKILEDRVEALEAGLSRILGNVRHSR